MLLQFRVINNLSYKTIGHRTREGSASLLCSFGISATLFYELQNEIHFIESISTKDNICNILIDDREASEKDLEEFFYSIAINYSHYSLNTNEIDGYINSTNPHFLFYKPNLLSIDAQGNIEKQEIINHWLNGLFHKNDGYTTPIHQPYANCWKFRHKR